MKKTYPDKTQKISSFFPIFPGLFPWLEEDLGFKTEGTIKKFKF